MEMPIYELHPAPIYRSPITTGISEMMILFKIPLDAILKGTASCLLYMQEYVDFSH
jgi:hypothetical protein